MSRKGENIYKRKDGRWEGRYIKHYDGNGKAKYGSVYAGSYLEVKKKLLTCKNGNECKEMEKEYLVKDMSYEWLDYQKKFIKESSYVRYYNIIVNHIVPNIGMYNIEKINERDIEDYVDLLKERGRLDGKGGLSNKSIRDIITILKEIIRFAKTHYKIHILPLGKLRLKNTSNQALKVLSKNDQKILANFLLNNVSSINLGILLSLYTGIRIGELCALKWENVNITEKILIIEHTLQRLQSINNNEVKTRIHITSPKSEKSIRTIPIPDATFGYVVNLQSNENEYLLTNSTTCMEPRRLQYYFHKTLEQLEMDHFNFHSLRHTFATRCIEVGVDIKILSEILGHANVNITLNRYVHPSLEQKRSNINKLTL